MRPRFATNQRLEFNTSPSATPALALKPTNSSADRQNVGLDWLEEHGDALYSYAMVRVTSPAVAEDLVQETFLSAIKSADSFRGAASKRTWLVGILKHKIVDYFRAASRHRQLKERVTTVHQPEKLTGRHFDRKHWGATPESAFTEQEFWTVFEYCREKLPENLQRAFVLREVDGLKTEEVCEILDVQPSNLAVRVHRARSLLRKCLESNWFTADR